jgi:hypothetical protein
VANPPLLSGCELAVLSDCIFISLEMGTKASEANDATSKTVTANPLNLTNKKPIPSNELRYWRILHRMASRHPEIAYSDSQP